MRKTQSLFRLLSKFMVFSFLFLCTMQNFAVAAPSYSESSDSSNNSASSYYSSHPNGILLAENSAESAEFRDLQEMADSGLAEAQFNLGLMYNDGNGVDQNYVKAREYYELAAKQGHADAQFQIGAMYHYGQGVPQNYTKAIHYYELAAKQGDVDAQYNLAGMYTNGEGVPQNYSRAYGYILVLIAIDPNDEEAKEMQTTFLNLISPKQIEEAQAFAAEMWEEIEAS